MKTGKSKIWDRVRAAPKHTGDAFEAHLEGTAFVLREWRQRNSLVLAGRYHAVCGNPWDLAPVCALDSPELAAEIGDEAARIVHLWARVERKSLLRELRSYQNGKDPIRLVAASGEPLLVTRQEYVDLAHLSAANEVEILSRHHAQCVRETVQQLHPVLCSAANARLATYDRPRPGSRWVALKRRLRRLLTASVRAQKNTN